MRFSGRVSSAWATRAPSGAVSTLAAAIASSAGR